MESNFMRDLSIAMAAFGPIFAIFGIGLFIGLLAALEKFGVLAKIERARLQKRKAVEKTA